jgi:hypothetical protein
MTTVTIHAHPDQFLPSSPRSFNPALYQPIAPPPAAVGKTIRMFDIECYRNYFLTKLYDRNTKQFFSFEFSIRKAFNWLALRAMLMDGTIVGFNSNKYDMLMLSAAATGRFTNDMLKNLSDYIILTKPSPQPWQIARDWGFEILTLDHIDLFEIIPGQGSLKIYAGRVHSRKMQDLPYAPDKILTYDEMDFTDLYCGNDLLNTNDLYTAVLTSIETREELTAMYCVDMRSKSDAQIAEAGFKKLLTTKVYPPQIPPGTRFQYTPAPFLRFTTPVMLDAFAMIQRTSFVIANSGQPEMPPELDKFEIKLGSSVYRLGIGGLHSSEKGAWHRAGDGVRLVDVDVVSYYPKIISILRMYPHQIGPSFLAIYEGWIATRIKYKNEGNKKKAATYKIKINGTFGKTGSKYSILYAPEMMIRTTITGQLALLMLIEMLVTAGMDCVSANTDGVVIKCTDAQVAQRDLIVRHWEALTGFETEANEYIALFSRDINSYLAAKPAYTDKKGVAHPIEFKTKGAFADDPDSQLAKNPTNIVCLDAVKAYLIGGVPLEQTIRRCDDIRKFVTIRGVKGGGEWVHDTLNAVTVGQKREVLNRHGWTEVAKGHWMGWEEGFDTHTPVKTDDAFKRVCMQIPRTYLGKAVRWYYGAGQKGHIAYASNGNLVARSEGAKPCMELPDVLPPDIDYEFYIREAKSLLKDLGINC